ncbi:MAG TPA: hypothetical protein VIZ43_08600 [Trebonia sp.]
MTSPKAYATEARLNALVAATGPVPAKVTVGNITAAGPTELTALTVPASTLAAGVKWTIEFSGYFSTGGTPPGSVTWTVNWGPVGNAISGAQIASLAIPGAGLLTSASNLGCRVRCTVWGKSATSTGTVLEVGWHTATGVAGSVSWFATANNTGLTGNVNRDLDLAFAYTGSGVTLTTDAVQIARAA